MWRMRCSFFLALALVWGSSSSLLAEEKTVLIYQSELNELITISKNLAEKNLLLENQLQTALQQSVEWEQKYNDLQISWKQYESETNQVIQKLTNENKLKTMGLWVLGGLIIVSFFGGAAAF